MRFLVSIEIDIPEGQLQPEVSLSDCAPEIIESILGEALKPDYIRWAGIHRIPESGAGRLQ